MQEINKKSIKFLKPVFESFFLLILLSFLIEICEVVKEFDINNYLDLGIANKSINANSLSDGQFKKLI